MTQIEAARRGEITPQIEQVAKDEFRDPEFVRERVADGRIAIPANINHANLHAHGVGEGLRTKVNVNLGISGDIQDAPQEWEKVAIAQKYGADAIMDLSNSGKTRVFRRQLIEKTPLMVGTVPMYDAIGYLETPLVQLTGDDLLSVVQAHAEDGVDFMTIHAGFNRRVLDTFMETGRLTNIVSRGGSLLFGWMMTTGKENPFYERFDDLLEICRKYDVTISLGDACRGGSTYDATDASEVAELIELGKLTKRAWDAGVQVVVEGPGHMALDEVAANMKLQKRLCHGAPFYVLGPLVTDIAPGYDHITAAIGGAVAASSGADWLCYVTPAEHLKLPDANDVREGLIATRIAAHAADIAKGVPHARDVDNKMSDARRRVDWDGMWECALDPERAQEILAEAPPSEEGTCTMCGKMCAARTVNRIMEGLTIDLGEEK
ncbi:phosphomethylpyrimidine synthase ThiC [Paratractidigestivibacter sp.]|uniref:phosphomethylpyrimidine synthase ThiC n=1 Tax=Paratractidigestivibacter sp. TaxID=2847316 RepID=UPI002ABDE2EF|nr:phosphomethylpyrimidine synthase ThiC [Paratractidigestivibacter sp.]